MAENKPSKNALDALEHPTNGPGYDEDELSSTKIDPLRSPLKEHSTTEHTHGVIGDDYIMQSSHLEPLPHGGLKHPEGVGHTTGERHHERHGHHGRKDHKQQMQGGGEVGKGGKGGQHHREDMPVMVDEGMKKPQGAGGRMPPMV